MSGLILPSAKPLLVSLMKKAGHLTRSTTAPRHLAKCADTPPDTCCTASSPDDIPDWVPASVTLPSLGGCCARVGGTYLLTQNPTAKCTFTFSTPISRSGSPCDDVDCSGGGWAVVNLLEVGISVVLHSSSLPSGRSISVTIVYTYGEYTDYRPGPLGCFLANFQYVRMLYEGYCDDRTIPFKEYIGTPGWNGRTPCPPASITLA